MKEQLVALSSLFREVFGVQQMRFKLLKREGYEGGKPLIHQLVEYLGRRGRPRVGDRRWLLIAGFGLDLLYRIRNGTV